MNSFYVVHLVTPVGDKEYNICVGVFSDERKGVDKAISDYKLARHGRPSKYIDVTQYALDGEQIKADYYEIEGGNAWLVEDGEPEYKVH